jgi:hypothetical protein
MDLIVSKFITHYLKAYIEKVDSSQMQMQFWKGHATFDNLTLRPTALSRHDLPLLIKRGMIGHVNVNFPWKHLTTEACVIEIDTVRIVANLDDSVLIKKDLEAPPTASSKKPLSEEDAKGTWQSLMSTVIDNARINIQNIHVRLEFNLGTTFVAIGFVIPQISLFTVDEQNVPVKTFQKFKVLRKQLRFVELSIYFDTTSEPVDLDDFDVWMQYMQSKVEHQYVMKPLTVECILIHSRDPQDVKNRLSVLTRTVGFSIDFLQCRALLEIQKKWNAFLLKRNFATCYRPIESAQPFDLWAYAQRCAIHKLRPHVFKPSFALTILRNRKEFIQLYRKKAPASARANPKAMVNPMMLMRSFSLGTLDKLQKSMGPEATALLTAMAEEEISRDTPARDSSITALAVSELKGLIRTSESFFNSSSFELQAQISTFELALDYVVGTPLFSIVFTELQANVRSLETGVDIGIDLTDLAMTGTSNHQSLPLMSSLKHPVLDFQYSIPASETSTLKMSIAGLLINIHPETISAAADFFLDFSKQTQDVMKKEEHGKVVHVDVAEQFQRIACFTDRGFAFRVSR